LASVPKFFLSSSSLPRPVRCLRQAASTSSDYRVPTADLDNPSGGQPRRATTLDRPDASTHLEVTTDRIPAKSGSSPVVSNQEGPRDANRVAEDTDQSGYRERQELYPAEALNSTDSPAHTREEDQLDKDRTKKSPNTKTLRGLTISLPGASKRHITFTHTHAHTTHCNY